MPPQGNGSVPVLARASLFGGPIERIAVPVGTSLSDIVAQALPRRLRPFAKVYLADDPRPVPPDRWPLWRPRQGVQVMILPVPQGGGGGGGKALRSAALLAVVVAAAAVAGPVGAAAGGGFAGGLAGASASAAVGIAGTLAVNALLPAPQAKLAGNDDAGSSAYRLDGVGNQLQPYGVVPVVLGWHRLTPPLAARPYTERIGDEQYMRFAVCWGVGPVTLTDIRIGETPIDDIPDVEQEHRLNAASDPDLELFPRSVVEDRLTIELKEVDDWESRTTVADTRWIVIELTAPLGLRRTSSNGKNVDERTVELEYRWRDVGGTWSDPVEIAMTGKTAKPVFKTIRITPPAAGQFEVAVRRVTDDVLESDQERILDRVVWTLLQAFGAGDPIDDAGVSRSAFRVKASEFANGTIDVSAEVRSLVEIWNGSAWASGNTSRNPAALARHVLRGTWINPDPKTDADLDLPGFEDWYEQCEAEGWTFEAAIDTEQSEQELLDRIGLVGRARVRFWDGKWRVFPDRADLDPVQMFTPRNSWGFELTRMFPRLPDALRVRFVDRSKEWKQGAEVIVYADGKSAANAELYEDIEFFGATGKTQNWKLGRYHFAAAQLRPEIFTFSVDFEYLAAGPGSRIALAHDVPLIGSGWGRAKARTTDGNGDVTSVTLDSLIAMDGPDHVLWVRKVDGALHAHPIADFIGETDTFTFLTPVDPSEAPYILSQEDLCVVGKADRAVYDLVIRDIEPIDDLSARLTCVAYAPEIHEADRGAIPDFDAGITLPVTFRTVPPVVRSIRSSDDVWLYGADGGFSPRILISLAAPIATTDRIVKVHVRWRLAATAVAWESQTFEADGGNILLSGVESGDRYEIMLRHISETEAGKRYGSAWTGPVVHVVATPTTPPPNVEQVWIDGDTVRWTDANLSIAHAGWLVRVSLNSATTWARATAAHGGVLSAPQIALSLLPRDAIHVYVKAVTRTGIESVAATRILVINRGPGGKRYVVDAQDYETAGWPGTITGGEIETDPEDGSTFIGSDSTAIFLANPALPFLAPPDAPFLAGAFAPLTYECDYTFPPTAKSTDQVVLDYQVTGVERIEVRLVGDALVVPADDDPLFGDADDADPLLPDDSAPLLGVFAIDPTRPYAPWRGFATPTPGEVLRIRVVALGGEVRAEVRRLIVRLEALEEQDGCTFTLPPAGSRVPPLAFERGTSFRALKWVRVIMIDDDSDPTEAQRPVQAVRLKPDPAVDARLGPFMRALNAKGFSVPAAIEITVGGF